MYDRLASCSPQHRREFASRRPQRRPLHADHYPRAGETGHYRQQQQDDQKLQKREAGRTPAFTNW